jgi:enoyl-CoA hydratase
MMMPVCRIHPVFAAFYLNSIYLNSIVVATLFFILSFLPMLQPLDTPLEYLIVTCPADGVVDVQLNRPKALNALNFNLMGELVSVLEHYDKLETTRCFLLHGDERAFAAGADIKELAQQTSVAMMKSSRITRWEDVRNIKKPVVAAVSGFALGGGCELAMLCDMIVASETAKFGQPEVKIGVIPGAGGTQRLTKAIGKARAMELILTGRMMSAQEALDAGLITKVVPPEAWYSAALELATEIASMPPVAIQAAKEAILKSFDLTIDAGLEFERRNFYLLFSTEDMREGMNAFIEKRKPTWTGK